MASRFLLLIALAPAAALVTGPLAGREIAPPLRLRGGLAGIDPVKVASVSTGLSCGHAASLGLVHEILPIFRYCGQVSDLSLLIIERSCWILVSGAILAAMTLTGMSVLKAVGWALLPLVLSPLEFILRGRAANMGFYRPNASYLLLIVNSLMMCACFAAPSSAKLTVDSSVGAWEVNIRPSHLDTALKAFAAGCAVSAVVMVAAPGQAAQV
ncbi:hypothetical protein T484DRAFT_1773515 [Baffinella frigidus]|nr:hypothetical protein T484DRAFT_1773515 [Cryptophyta sp. CCMP2293]